MIKVVNEVEIYEIGNGVEAASGTKPLLVQSHWNLPERVILKRGTMEITVLADDLIAAIKNATNTERF